MPQFTIADRYKILFVNSGNIRIGNHIAKKGLEFSDSETIIWTSEKQALKVLNVSNNRIVVIPAKGFKRFGAKSLADYLRKNKHLSTRSYGISVTYADTIYYLIDTLLINAGKHYGDRLVDEAVVIIGMDSIFSKIQKTKDKKYFILTRSIFGGRSPQIAHIDIVETDRQKNWRYYVYHRLRVDLIPMKAD